MHAQMKVKDHEKSKLIKLNMTFSVTRQLYLVTYLTKSCVCTLTIDFENLSITMRKDE